MNPRIKERPTWDEYFIAICEVVKTRSLDCRTQVGSLIIDKHNRIVSTGYNSYPPGVKDEDMPFDREGKYIVTTHAEANCIISAGRSVEGCIIYVPFLPCPECMKLIIGSRISEIKYWTTYESGVNKDDLVKKLAEQTGIKLTKIR